MVYIVIFIACLILLCILVACCCRARFKKEAENEVNAIAYENVDQLEETLATQEATKSYMSRLSITDKLVAVEEDKPKVLSVRKPKKQTSFDDFD